MCEPTTIIAAMTIASTAMAGYSMVQQGRNAKSTAKFNSREAENEATRTRNKGVEEEVKHRNKVANLQSQQRAQLGAANVDLRSGSALDIQEEAALLGEVDSLRVRTNFSDQASSLDRSAYLTEIQGDNAQTQANISAAGSLIGGTAGAISAGVAPKWYSPNSAATTTSGVQANSQFGAIA